MMLIFLFVRVTSGLTVSSSCLSLVPVFLIFPESSKLSSAAPRASGWAVLGRLCLRWCGLHHVSLQAMLAHFSVCFAFRILFALGLRFGLKLKVWFKSYGLEPTFSVWSRGSWNGVKREKHLKSRKYSVELNYGCGQEVTYLVPRDINYTLRRWLHGDLFIVCSFIW